MEIIFFVLGLICGGFGAFLYFKGQKNLTKDLTPELNQAREEVANVRGQLASLTSNKQKLEADFAASNKTVLELTSKNSTLLEKQSSTDEKLQNLTLVKDSLSKEFENLSNKIFQSKMENFQKESSQNMETVMKPFKDKLSEFQTTVIKYREEEVRDVTSLKTELVTIFKLNQQLSTDAENLTKALKGDNKAQGNWGELILNNVLEASGLRDGHEYTLQGEEMGLKNIDGRIQKPDVIINLPDNKHIIVDAKVSLIGYERFIAAVDEKESGIGMKDFIASLKGHIKGLSGKEYHKLDKLITPDFVLMFIPIEGAFSTALQNDSGIFQYGWDNKVILVSPTTLMVTLRTVESIWKQENQNKNAIEIARQAGALYDKFHGFVDDLNDLKKSLDKSQENLSEAMKKLSSGKGNLVGSVVKLKELGAKASKQLAVDHEE